MTTIKPALIPSTDLLNVKREGFGIEMLDAKPGRFVVLKECSYTEAEEFRSYAHDGSARSRARAYGEARNAAARAQDYSGEQAAYNVYEEEEAQAEESAALPDVSKLDDASLYTLSMFCSTVRNEIRKKDISLRALKAIRADRTLENPYDSRTFPLTPVIWAHVMKCVTNRIEETCAGLLALEQRADGEYTAREVLADNKAAAIAESFAVGDTINDGGIIRRITGIKGAAIAIIDGIIERPLGRVERLETCRIICERIATATNTSYKNAFESYIGTDFNEAAAINLIERRRIEAEAETAAANDTTPSKLEPAADIYRMTYPEIVAAIQVEKAQPCGTKPTARAFLALMLTREERFLPPDTDGVRDVLQSQLVSAYLHGIITASEWQRVNSIATGAGRPRELLRTLREALLRGADIIDAMKTATAAE